MKKENRMTFKLKVHFFKRDIAEIIRFDLGCFTLPVTILTTVTALLFILSGRGGTGFKLLSKLYQTNWPLAEELCTILLKRVCRPGNGRLQEFFATVRDAHIYRPNYPPIAQKFVTDPEKFFPGMCIVLKGYENGERGVIVLKYSYSFPLFLRLFDVDKIAQRYFIVLEPSWNGYFNLDILSYLKLEAPVFVQAQEPRDARLLKNIRSNLYPVPLGTNWWVDHQVFKPLHIEKDADIIMVASWANFKRHYKFFRILKNMRKRGKVLRTILVGYPIERSLDEIREQASFFGIEDQIEFYEWLSPEEVNLQMNRAKVNLVWSRYEGNNRVLLEGMFAGVPFILREGFNYGYKYPFVNNQTGLYANERNLAHIVSYILTHTEKFKSREWALKNMSYERAVDILHASIRRVALSLGERFDGNISPKVNELHGMRYATEEGPYKYKRDYEYLKSCRRL